MEEAGQAVDPCQIVRSLRGEAQLVTFQATLDAFLIDFGDSTTGTDVLQNITMHSSLYCNSRTLTSGYGPILG